MFLTELNTSFCTCHLAVSFVKIYIPTCIGKNSEISFIQPCLLWESSISIEVIQNSNHISESFFVSSINFNLHHGLLISQVRLINRYNIDNNASLKYRPTKNSVDETFVTYRQV